MTVMVGLEAVVAEGGQVEQGGEGEAAVVASTLQAAAEAARITISIPALTTAITLSPPSRLPTTKTGTIDLVHGTLPQLPAGP